MLSDHVAKYYAHALTQHEVDGVGRISQSLFDAQVDLNPHQIEAALFALHSPLSKGVILADEVGLGKTIEAGIILCQLWAEKKRRILIICPASIRKQWAMELEEKFNLPAVVMDAKEYNARKKKGNPRPFDAPEVVIVSYPFANRFKEEIRSIPFDLAAIDEAHKLKNCYRPSNKMGKGIRWALEDKKKILLTATPLQNSLLEIYGLSTLIDENIFTDANSFRSQFMRMGGDIDGLRQRLSYFCKRTLRRDVVEYISYTDRKPITQPFEPTDDEQAFYERVSEFIQREDLYSIPSERRHLVVLVLRKLLASSSEAIISTLQRMLLRLHDMRDGKLPNVRLIDDFIADDTLDAEFLDDFLDEVESEEFSETTSLPEISITSLTSEISDLDQLIKQGLKIGIETKTRSLTTALDLGFEQMESTGAAHRALIFTESRRTQEALKLFLDENGHRGKVILFNGSNNSPETKLIYEQWIAKNAGNGKASGSKPVDMRTAIIEHFRDEGNILIATEAAAEGVNMQFCSLIINFDLPWNPQRVEQRIGRCHRYGQKHDVVVINFLNIRNEADQRVHQLLTEKFHLFDTVFGASDEVLGSIESGVDFEKRVLEIYQTCRTPSTIKTAFDQLQLELKDSIDKRLAETERKLIDHFDEDVHQRLKLELAETHLRLDKVARQFWLLSKHIIADGADWDDQHLSFLLHRSLTANAPTGHYHLISKQKEQKELQPRNGYLYRLSHPLGEYVLDTAKSRPTPAATIIFDTQLNPAKISLIEELRGTSGYLSLTHLKIQSYELEEFLLFSAYTDDGKMLDQETCEKLFSCHAHQQQKIDIPPLELERLTAESQRHTEATIHKSLERNNVHFQQASSQIYLWAEDAVLASENAIADTKAQILFLSRQARQAESIEQQRELQSQIQELERKKRRQRKEIFDKEDEIYEKRDGLIDQLESRLSNETLADTLFTIQFQII